MGGIKVEDRNINSIDKLSEKEIRMVNRVLENYSFDVIKFVKVRSAYKLETSFGNICLKRMKHGEHKPLNGSILVQELVDKGFHNIAKYYKTKNDRIYVKYRNSFFYATEWIDGEECNLDSIEEAKNCVKLLAHYHIASSNIDIKRFKIKNNLKNWPVIFKHNLQDLEKFERIINRKKIKSEFDIAFGNYIESIYHRGMVAINFLNTSDYYKLSRQASQNKIICHDSFYYQNIIKKDEEYYIIDLDSIIVDLHVNDLGKLIRRLMFKRSYKWDFEKAKILIEEYNSISKFDKSELEVMLALIIFPHKFWKLGKKRYIKHKGWDESKYMHKLNRLVRYNDNQNKFLEDYLNYIKDYQ